MPHKIYQCCDSNKCTCGLKEKLYGNDNSTNKPKERVKFVMAENVPDLLTLAQDLIAKNLEAQRLRSSLNQVEIEMKAIKTKMKNAMDKVEN